VVGLWGDSAINAFVNLTPSSPWATRVAEQWKGLPFGKYLQRAPSRRQRRLTGTFDPMQESLWNRLHLFSSSEAEHESYEQLGSTFLARLPLDVRMIIYEMVIGGMILHIESGTPVSRIYHVICNRPKTIDQPNHQCDEMSMTRPSSAPREDYAEASGLLPLLVTCRKVYSECIHTLYSMNKFLFTSNHAAFRFLKVMIPSHRVQSIRHFRMTMRIPHHPYMNTRSKRDWLALWEFFANDMSGLRTLYLKFLMLHDTQQQISESKDGLGAEWTQPMMLMAAETNRMRGCTVELVTGNQHHDLNAIYRDAVTNMADEDHGNSMDIACDDLQKRIRLSLKVPG
jgi:hypothetical protein